MKNFRDIIIREMKARGWSSYRLSQETGDRVPKRTVQRYVAGDHGISIEYFEQLCRALGLDLTKRRRKGR